MWWQPHKFEQKRPFLEQRIQLLKAVKAFFDAQGFLEVETPILQVCPGLDTHVHGFKTEVLDHGMKWERDLYLHTSPEFAMKKLLVAGLPKIYQVCHVFRNAEGSSRHSLEFTMLEWYRANAGYRDVIDDCVELLRHVASALKLKNYKYKDAQSDPFKDWEIITVSEAFQKYADINLEKYLPLSLTLSPINGGEGSERSEQGEGDVSEFRKAVSALGIRTATDDRWDDLFFRVMAEKIEPHLGVPAPTIIYNYPVSMASLARKCSDDPRFAERFEMYVCGIELCNGFGELTDAAEQRKRFKEELELKGRLYGETYPVDEDFLKALEHGLPESGGNAMGIDRLVMLATGAEDIDHVLWCGKP